MRKIPEIYIFTTCAFLRWKILKTLPENDSLICRSLAKSSVFVSSWILAVVGSITELWSTKVESSFIVSPLKASDSVTFCSFFESNPKNLIAI